VRESGPRTRVHPAVAWARRNRSRILVVAVGLVVLAVYVWFFEGAFFGSQPLRAGTYDQLDAHLESGGLEQGRFVASVTMSDAGWRDLRYTVHSDSATAFKLEGKSVSQAEFAAFAKQAFLFNADMVVGEGGLLLMIDQREL